MKNIAIQCFISLVLFPFNMFALENADDPVIVKVGKHSITKSEFLRIYNKNNSQNAQDNKSIREYMDLFINYRLKVEEAENLGLDTVRSFVKEFTSYRDQLAKPYFTDNETEEKMYRESYNRMLYEVHARQIFLKLDRYAPPADTLAVYKKAISVRERLIKGEPWDSVAFKFSQDNSVKKTKGDIGYFTAFQMLWPFELAAYSLKVNEISMPFRTRTGYAILQLLDKRPSRGEIKVEHIMASFPENSTAKSIDSARAKIEDIYSRILKGENFEELAKKYSDDKRSAEKGGEVKWFYVGQMIPEFENAAFALTKDGEISKPVRTTFGWHIIKRVATRPISSYENNKDIIKQRLENNDDLFQLGHQVLVEKIKKEINFKDNKSNLLKILPLLDSSFFKNAWSPDKVKPIGKEVLFTLPTKSYTVQDFANYLVAKSRFRKPIAFEVLLEIMYKDFVISSIIDFENSRLESIYPDFRYLVQEYHDGILLFNLMEQKIWNKAANDSVGLQKFFNDNKDGYKWGERVDALVVTSPNKSAVDEAYKMAPAYQAGSIKSRDIIIKVCKGDTTNPCINVTEALFEKGDNNILDSIGWSVGISELVNRDGKYGFFVKKGLIGPAPKTFQETRGICIADYQQYLEQLYLKELRKKYEVVVNEKVLAGLSKQ
jgi:peptidyl-prolyl cis-trans isomerase SurA